MAMTAVAVAGCSGPQSRSLGCSKDTDCKDPRVCEHSLCVERPVPADAARVDDAAAATATATGTVAGAPPFAMFGGDARHTGRRGGAAPKT